MKKMILSLLAISTILSAEAVRLKCSFPGYEDGAITIYLPQKEFNYTGPGYCSSSRPTIAIGDNLIFINAHYCSIEINRATGDVQVGNFRDEKVYYKGTCVRQSNAI